MDVQLCIPVAFGFVYKLKPGATPTLLSEHELFFVPGVAVKAEDYEAAERLLQRKLAEYIKLHFLDSVPFDPSEGMPALERLIAHQKTPIGLLSWKITKMSVMADRVSIDKEEGKRV